MERVTLGESSLKHYDAQHLRDLPQLRFVSTRFPHGVFRFPVIPFSTRCFAADAVARVLSSPAAVDAPECDPRRPVHLSHMELPDCELPEQDNSILVETASRRNVLTGEEQQHHAVYHHATGICAWVPAAEAQLQSDSKPLYPSVGRWLALTERSSD